MRAAAAASTARWEHFPHAADVGVRGFGKSAAEAFEQAALALAAVITHAEVAPKVPSSRESISLPLRSEETAAMD